VISPWFELSLAASHVREKHAATARLTVYFGYDNAYLYLVQDPAVAIALGREGDMAAELAANDFLLLDDAKMSTSRAHGIDAIAVLARAPADLVRLYLAKIRPEDSKMTSGVAAAQVFLTMVARFWQMWLLRLGLAIDGEFDGVAPQPANPSLVPWPQEQRDFLASLEALVARARRGYDASSLKEPSTVIHELVERTVAFGAAQAALAKEPSLAAQRATGIALELAAARALAMIVAPVMPLFAQQLWAALGFGADEPNGWYDDVPPFPAGQRIALGTTRFFPDSIVLT
jgi:methionyl-tRNA synthetase